MGKINSDESGQIFSLDLLLALIPLTIILGIVGADMDNIMYLVQDSVFRSSTDRVASDTLNTLIETSGYPTTWDQTGTVNVAGLAMYDSIKNASLEGKISTSKLNALKDSDVQKLVGNNYGFYLNVSEIVNASINSYNTIDLRPPLGTLNKSAKDIVRVERMALYSKVDVVYSIKDQISGVGVSMSYNKPTFDVFQTSGYHNQTYDYWIIFNNSGYSSGNVNCTINSKILNFTNINAPTKINSTYLNLDPSNPSKILANTVIVSANGAPGTKLDFYIVQVQKNTNMAGKTANDTVLRPCRFELYLWAK